MPNLYLQQADGTPVATFRLYNDFTARAGQEEVVVLGIIPEAVSAVPVPAGSYTRTDEPVDPEGDAAFWRARAEKVERELRESAEALDTTMGRAIKAERERDELRSLYEGQIEVIGRLQRAAESRPLTPDAITDQFVDYVHEDYFWSTEDRVRLEKPALKHALLDGVKRLAEATARPEGAEEWDRRAFDAVHDVLARTDLSNLSTQSRTAALYAQGVRVVTEEQP